MKCVHLFCKEEFEITWVKCFRFTVYDSLGGRGGYTSMQKNTAPCGKVAHRRYIEGFLQSRVKSQPGLGDTFPLVDESRRPQCLSVGGAPLLGKIKCAPADSKMLAPQLLRRGAILHWLALNHRYCGEVILLSCFSNGALTH